MTEAVEIWERAWAAFQLATENGDNPNDKAAEVIAEALRARDERITALEAEVARKDESLRKCAEPNRYHAPCPTCGPKTVERGCYIARAALEAALREAETALRDYACYGPEAPCIRPKHECQLWNVAVQPQRR